MGEENWKEKYLSFCSLAEITILLLFINLLFATGKKKKKTNKQKNILSFCFFQDSS